jgi:hypothetical protein
MTLQSALSLAAVNCDFAASKYRKAAEEGSFLASEFDQHAKDSTTAARIIREHLTALEAAESTPVE